MADILVIFTKNPVRGKVKTRIAAKIGEGPALKIHQLLFNKTLKLLESLPDDIESVIYFSEIPKRIPGRVQKQYRIEIQNGEDLGRRMSMAIQQEKQKGANRICLIGSDIYDLKAEIVVGAFDSILKNDLVIGPAGDGGYYLIGMVDHHPNVFENIHWGSSTVLSETISAARKMGLTYELLKSMNDVDEFGDLPMEIVKKLNL